MNTEKTKILLVEDEKPIRQFLRVALEDENCAVTESATLHEGSRLISILKPNLLILDLGLPDGHGIELIRDVRHWSDLPILILSAHSEEAEKIEALDAGADDYLTKPFGIGELRARVRALLRRQHKKTLDNNTPLVAFGEIVVDLSCHRVTREQKIIHLTPIEYRLLALLVGQPSKVLTHRYLLREIWGAAYIESNHYLRIYVGHLRQKLERDPTQPEHILTETGIGYRFQP